MRGIKFRAWDTASKQMCEWKLCENHNVKNDIGEMFVGPDGFTYPWEHPDLIKLEFTGLPDKNGKDIYEADILKDPRDKKGHIVVYHKASFGYWFDQGSGSEFFMLYRYLENMEVIGNVYQNPELLPY